MNRKCRSAWTWRLKYRFQKGAGRTAGGTGVEAARVATNGEKSAAKRARSGCRLNMLTIGGEQHFASVAGRVRCLAVALLGCDCEAELCCSGVVDSWYQLSGEAVGGSS